MVAGKSPEWLPSGFTEKVKNKNGRRIKYYHNASTGATYYSKKGVLSSITEENSPLGMPKTSNGNENNSPSDSQIDAGLDITDGSPKWLPDGWLSEEKTRERGSRRGSTYKVYTDVSSGKKFYSRAAVTQYLNTVDRADTVDVQTEFDKADEPSPNLLSMINTGDSPEDQKDDSFKTFDKANEPSPNCLSMINTVGIPEEEKKGDSFKTLDKVDDPSTHTSPQCQSMIMTNTDSISRKKKDSIFKTVHVEPAAVDDLPPGWIKEIITRKSGKKTRKDPYYTDPVSGYMFRSKPDALRFIKTNDIGKCAIRPKKRELGDLNLAKNENLSPISAHEKSPEHEGHVFVDGESNGCLQNSDTKEPSISEAQIPNQTTSNNNDTDGAQVISEENIPCQNQMKNTEPENELKPKYAVSKEEPTETVQVEMESINSRKRKVPNSPSQDSKRLSGSEPGTVSDSALNEVATEEANPSQPSDIELAREIEPPKEIEIEPPPPPRDAENPPNGDPIVEEQNKQDSPLLFDFGESWADPLEFALKTLRGDIPIEDTLAATPGYFNVNLPIPHNNNRINDCLRSSSESDKPNIFQNKAAGTSKRQDNSLFSGLGNIGLPDFDGFSGQRKG